MKKILILLFIITLSGSSFAQAGWQWQNPYLQGNDLNSIVMIGAGGWAVGDMGVVMRTHNSGLDWEIVDLRTSRNLNCIYMEIISGKGWIVGDNGTIFYTENTGDTWTKQYSGTSEHLYSITAESGDCPWICGHDVVLHSYNHGETWEKISTPVHTWFWEIDQKDCDEIWVCGNQGLVMSTKDHGASWQIHTVPTTYNLMGIDVVRYGDYRACGNQVTIISSDDFGETWVKEYQAPFLNMYAVETKGIVGPAYAVGDKGHIFETLDGGTTWTDKESPTIYQLNDVCFKAGFESDDIYATGWYGQVIRKLEPANAEFEMLNKKPNHYMMDMDFINADTGWAVGGDKIDLSGTIEGIVLHTTNGGATWEEQLNISKALNCVEFINGNEGWAVGTYGMIRHTTNGGKNWATQSSPLTGSLNTVYFVDKDNGWIVSKDNWGEIAHTTNGGNTWLRQTAPTRNPLVDVFFIDVNKGWIVGMDSTLLRTSDGGQTWLRCDLTVTNNWFFRSVYFIDEMHGWTVGNTGIIMLTIDGGITWQEIKTGFSETLLAVYFIDPQNGWATGVDGTILRSLDGGYTWFKQYSGVSRNILASVYFVNLNDGWVCGEGGTIKRTINGGFWNEPGTFLRNRLNLPITDMHETRDTLVFEVSGLKAKSNGYQLVGLEVMIDSIMHSRASDLVISLSHNGITKTLVNQVTGQGTDFLWTRFADDAKKTITNGVAPFSGKYKPLQPLTSFNGLNPEGDWVLTVYDSKTGNTGTLNAWGIMPLYEKLISVGKPEVKAVEPEIQLFQNVPNPFTGITEIKWSSGIDGYTTLKVYNINGQEINTLVNKLLPKGEYSVEFDGTQFSAGVYYYQLRVGDYALTKRCIVM